MSGCRNKTAEKRISSGDISMTEVDSLQIHLDSLTTQSTSYLQLVGDSTIAFFNKPNSDIVLYNIKNGTTSKIKIFKEGPNAVHGVTGFCFLNPDSIWLYSQWGYEINLIDSKGNRTTKYKLSTDKDSSGNILQYAVNPYPTTTTPYIVKNHIHYLAGMNNRPNDGQLPGTVMIFDEKNGSWKTGVTYPAEYGSTEDLAKWDPFAYRQVQYTMDPQGKMIMNFPASDSLFVYDPRTGTMSAHYAAYSEPTNIHLCEAKTPEESIKNFLKQYCYTSILYDKYNDVYYRIIRKPIESEAEDLNAQIRKKPISIIILNKTFDKIGEFSLPNDEYYHNHVFVTSDGLHINKLSDDDDIMKFRVFRIIDK